MLPTPPSRPPEMFPPSPEKVETMETRVGQSYISPKPLRTEHVGAAALVQMVMLKDVEAARKLQQGPFSGFQYGALFSVSHGWGGVHRMFLHGAARSPGWVKRRASRASCCTASGSQAR